MHDVKQLLREHKQDEVLESEIDELCDEAVALLTGSLDSIAALLQFLVTDNDVKNTEETKNRLIYLI